MKVSFNGNYLVKFPSERAKELTILNAINNTHAIEEGEMNILKAGKNSVQILTGQDLEDYLLFSDFSIGCEFTKDENINNIVRDLFLKKADIVDFSKLKEDEGIIQKSLNYLLECFKKDKSLSDDLKKSNIDSVKELMKKK